jgi:hypothetical protein
MQYGIRCTTKQENWIICRGNTIGQHEGIEIDAVATGLLLGCRRGNRQSPHFQLFSIRGVTGRVACKCANTLACESVTACPRWSSDSHCPLHFSLCGVSLRCPSGATMLITRFPQPRCGDRSYDRMSQWRSSAPEITSWSLPCVFSRVRDLPVLLRSNRTIKVWRRTRRKFHVDRACALLS